MPLQKLQYRPGINREGTNYSNEGGFYQCDKIRFRSGYPEKIGGWNSISNPDTYTYSGVARTMWNWIALDGSNLNGVGTNQKLYVENGGNYNDVTPWAATAVTLGANPITVVSGSKLVTITASGHGATPGTWVTFAGATAVGGLTIVGAYEIITVPDGNSYTIISPTAASSGATGGGSAVTAHYQINAGGAVYTTGIGWGAGAWSRGTWGSGATVGIGQQLRLWSMDSFGQDMLAAPRNGPIYYWAKDTTSYTPAVTLSSLANATQLTTATAAQGVAFGSPVTTITVPADIVPFISPGCVISGTGIVAGTYITTAWDYSTSVTISVATTGSASGTYIFYYSGQAVPTSTLQVFVSPTQRFVIAMGANSYDPTNLSTTFDPLLVRWSDQENPYDWVPTAANQAGELRLSNGSTIVATLHGRQENLIFTDTALFVMQYLGPPYVWKFNLIEGNLSVMSPNSAVTVNNVTYWMGMDKFYSYSGTVNTLPCTLRQFVFGNLNLAQSAQVVCGSNEAFNEVWWHYPSYSSQVNDSYVIYNYLENLWYYGSLNRTAWLDSSLRPSPMAAFSCHNSYLSAAIDATTTSIVLIDSTSYPYVGAIKIDSEIISYTANSGTTLTGCVRGYLGTTAATHTAYTAAPCYVPNQVMYHEVGMDDGSLPVALPIESYISSSDFDIGDGDRFAFVWRMLPDVSFAGSTVDAPQVFLQIAPRVNSGSAYNTTTIDTVVSANNYDPSTGSRFYTIETYTGQVYTRLRGRQMSFKISSTGLGVDWQLGVPRIDIRPDGKR
jgi:hypothetical protein